ncbi:hypothetical protein diail_5493 [Diaporthe ilicicola]|nr:hypothetical protein diail_5493 [Diaporthe ilicicola]
MSHHPSDPSSDLSKKARLAHWITGGTGRGPSTMSSFTGMVRDRNDVKKASEAWALSRQSALDEHQQRWGSSGVVGAVDQARGTAPKPKGTALIRWSRENGGGGQRAGDAAGQPVQPAQPAQQHQQQVDPVEDGIYGAGDDAVEARTEGGNTGDGDAIPGTGSGDPVGSRETAETGDHQQEESPARPAQCEGDAQSTNDAHSSFATRQLK